MDSPIHADVSYVVNAEGKAIIFGMLYRAVTLGSMVSLYMLRVIVCDELNYCDIQNVIKNDKLRTLTVYAKMADNV